MQIIKTLSLASAFLLFTMTTWADAPPPIKKRFPIVIEHLNVDYADKLGNGNVENMSYQVENFSFLHTKLQANLEMKDSTLVIDNGSTKFSIHKILNFINRFDSIHAEDFNFYLEDSRFHGNFEKGATGFSKHLFMLNSAKVECGLPGQDITMEDDTLQFFLDVCFVKGSVHLDEMTFPEEGSDFRTVVETALKNLVETEETLKEKSALPIKIERIRDLQISVNNHQLEARARIKTWFEWVLSASGNVVFEVDSGRYRIEMDQAHAGIFGIKKILFWALRKMKDPNIAIDEPYIYITYKNVKDPK